MGKRHADQIGRYLACPSQGGTDESSSDRYKGDRIVNFTARKMNMVRRLIMSVMAILVMAGTGVATASAATAADETVYNTGTVSVVIREFLGETVRNVVTVKPGTSVRHPKFNEIFVVKPWTESYYCYRMRITVNGISYHEPDGHRFTYRRPVIVIPDGARVAISARKVC